MTWKKDLAKLKQELGNEDLPAAKAAPPPKPREGQPAPRSMEEEDSVFLSAMGVRSRPARPDPGAAALREEPPATLEPAAPPPSSSTEFSSALGDLKGVKPLGTGRARVLPSAPKAPVAAPAALAQAPPPVPGPAAVAPAPSDPEPPAPEAPVSTPGPVPAVPPQVQIHLAAGMALVVDGSLDLKGHARSDAEERLKERILDGYALGWRTLHVLVGSSPELRQVVLDLLASPAGSCVARFAQAPIPMGGTQAWILYFRSPGISEN
jgi:DNA-nicking Smr family endonuclease